MRHKALWVAALKILAVLLVAALKILQNGA